MCHMHADICSLPILRDDSDCQVAIFSAISELIMLGSLRYRSCRTTGLVAQVRKTHKMVFVPIRIDIINRTVIEMTSDIVHNCLISRADFASRFHLAFIP